MLRESLRPGIALQHIICCFTILVVIGTSITYGVNVPLEFHGRGFLGKYLNSDTTRFNMDASVALYCRMLNYKWVSFFTEYRDDLDMAEQRGGVSLDPRYAHYYITAGFEISTKKIDLIPHLIHDCIHDIDYEVQGTPLFNRFRIRLALPDFHISRRIESDKQILWAVELGYYPHWLYHGWDINDGADYQYEIITHLWFDVLEKERFGLTVYPLFHFTKGDSIIYHQHQVASQFYYKNNGQRIGLELKYHLWNNDIIKNPEKLWLLSAFAEF